MSLNPEEIRKNPAFRDLYRLATEYEDIGSEEINPSMHKLSRINQRYISPEPIAEGGMKCIYRVYDAHARRYLAMAKLNARVPEDAADPFIHEAWLTAQLDHPNIITIHDVGVGEGGQPYFTMDLKQGDTLHDLIEKLHAGNRKTKNLYSLENRLQIFLKICDAISYAHSRNVLHLDLKPANIQIGEYGRVLVCDWGLGRVLGGESKQDIDRMLFNPDLLGSTNLYGQLKGTPGYMAPEQLKKDGKIDARTDVYGLGCILYSLLTFVPPVDGEDKERIKKTREGAIVSPEKTRPEGGVPKALNAVTMKAVATDPADRYSSVDRLRSDVQRYLTGFATEAENADVIQQLSLFFRRNRRFCLTILSSSLLLTGVVIWAFLGLHEKEQVASEARMQTERTLAMYEAGQDQLDKVSADNTKSIINLAYSYMIGRGDRSLAIFHAALEESPEDPDLLRALGLVHFCEQRFNQSLPYFERGADKQDHIHQAAIQFAADKKDREVLRVDQMQEMLDVLENQGELMMTTVAKYLKKHFDFSDRAVVIEYFLKRINSEWKDGWFEYDSERGCLRLGGRGLKLLTLGRSVLSGLNLRELDLSGSEVGQLWSERDLGVERLDIRGMPIDTLWPLKNMNYLQELVITPEQQAALNLDILPKRLHIDVRSLP